MYVFSIIMLVPFVPLTLFTYRAVLTIIFQLHKKYKTLSSKERDEIAQSFWGAVLISLIFTAITGVFLTYMIGGKF